MPCSGGLGCTQFEEQTCKQEGWWLVVAARVNELVVLLGRSLAFKWG